MSEECSYCLQFMLMSWDVDLEMELCTEMCVCSRFGDVKARSSGLFCGVLLSSAFKTLYPPCDCRSLERGEGKISRERNIGGRHGYQ